MKYFIAVCLVFTFNVLPGFSQSKKTDLPGIDIKTLDGKWVSAKTIQKDKPMVISFGATWCKPCVRELDAIRDVLPDWNDEFDFQMVTVSVDDSRSEHRVAPFVKAREWNYEFYLDPNSELKRALNAPTVPHTFLYNKKGKLVWQHSGFTEGDEDELYEKLLEVTKK